MFARLETTVAREFGQNDMDEIFSSKGKHVVPDITGDGVPDFVEVSEEKGGRVYECVGVEENDEWKQFETTRSLLMIEKGVYNKSGGLMGSGESYILDKYVYNEDYKNCVGTYSKDEHFPTAWGLGILLPEVKDYNGDNKNDVSYWKFMGRDVGYRQIIQLGE